LLMKVQWLQVKGKLLVKMLHAVVAGAAVRALGRAHDLAGRAVARLVDPGRVLYSVLRLAAEEALFILQLVQGRDQHSWVRALRTPQTRPRAHVQQP